MAVPTVPTSAADVNIASNAFFGQGDSTAYAKIAANLNAGLDAASAFGGSTLATKALSTTATQATTSTTPVDVTGFNVSVVIPTGDFSLHLNAPSVTLSTAGVFASFFIKDDQGSPVTYKVADTPAASAASTNEIHSAYGSVYIASGTYTVGSTHVFKVQYQTNSGTATLNQGVLSSQTVTPTLRAVLN